MGLGGAGSPPPGQGGTGLRIGGMDDCGHSCKCSNVVGGFKEEFSKNWPLGRFFLVVAMSVRVCVYVCVSVPFHAILPGEKRRSLIGPQIT